MIPLPPPPPSPAPSGSDLAPRRGPGRPPGRRNNATLMKEAAAREALAAITPASGPASASALTLLQCLYRDDRLPLEVRMKAAALAAPLEVPRPSPAPPPKDDGPLHARLRDAMIRTGRLPAPAPPPGLTPEEDAELREMLALP
jgi:hypothetical protein